MASSFVCFAMSSSSRKRGSSSTSSGPPDSKHRHVTARTVEKLKLENDKALGTQRRFDRVKTEEVTIIKSRVPILLYGNRVSLLYPSCISTKVRRSCSLPYLILARALYPS